MPRVPLASCDQVLVIRSTGSVVPVQGTLARSQGRGGQLNAVLVVAVQLDSSALSWLHCYNSRKADRRDNCPTQLESI
jgi:hypothetical protein